MKIPTLLTLWILAVVPGWGQTPASEPAEPERAPEEQRVEAADIEALLEDGKVFFLDVREPSELEELGTLPGYVNIPVGQLEERLDELPKDRAILTA